MSPNLRENADLVAFTEEISQLVLNISQKILVTLEIIFFKIHRVLKYLHVNFKMRKLSLQID